MPRPWAPFVHSPAPEPGLSRFWSPASHRSVQLFHGLTWACTKLPTVTWGVPLVLEECSTPIPHITEREEEEEEEVIFRHQRLTRPVRAAQLQSSLHPERQELSEVIFDCPELLLCPISASRALPMLCTAHAGCCRGNWGSALSQPPFVPQTSSFPVSHRSTGWGRAASQLEQAEQGLGPVGTI